MRVLYTVGFNNFNRSVISFDREAHLVNSIALADLIQQAFVPFGEFGRFVETSFHRAKKKLYLCDMVSFLGYSNRSLLYKNINGQLNNLFN